MVRNIPCHRHIMRDKQHGSTLSGQIFDDLYDFLEDNDQCPQRFTEFDFSELVRVYDTDCNGIVEFSDFQSHMEPSVDYDPLSDEVDNKTL